MWMLLIPLVATAIGQAGLAVVCFRRYPRARIPAASLACLTLGYLLSATLGYDCLLALHRPSSFDPLSDWVDLLIQQIIVTGSLFAAACAANIWLAFSIPVDANAKRRVTMVDADASRPVT